MVMSIAGFADKTWALRNTSAMMYSTLSSRIFGVKKTDDEQKISSSEFFSRFPVLQKVLMDHLGLVSIFGFPEEMTSYDPKKISFDPKMTSFDPKRPRTTPNDLI